jgi:hypothetical protein
MSDAPQHTGWKHFGWGDYRYMLSNGKIVGRIYRSCRSWWANDDIMPLGEYDTEENAKTAVEKSMPFQMEVRDV